MRSLIFIISFFVYSGYYAGLAIIFALNLSSLSRYYSIPLRIIILVIMLYVLRVNWRNIIPHKYSLFIALFIVFWLFYFLKVLFTENFSNDQDLSLAWYEFIFYALTYVVVPFITFLSIDYKKYKYTVLDGMILSGFVMGLVSTYVYGNLLISGVGRISMLTYKTGEIVLSPLALSYAGALTIVLCIYRLVILKEKRKFHKIFLFVTIALSFVMFLLGSSRGSVVALALTLPLFILFSPIKQKFTLIFLMIIASPILFWIIGASGSNIFERIGNTEEDRGGGRNVLWKEAISQFIDNPIFGGKIEVGGIYPHNLVLEILMATGIIGAFLILTVIFKGFKVSFKLSQIDKSNIFILLIMIQAFVQHFFTAGFYTSTILFVPIAIAFSLKNTICKTY